MADGQIEQGVLDGAQVAPDEPADGSHLQRGGGVGHVLHGGAVIDVLAGVLGQLGLKLAHQPEGRVRCPAGLGPDRGRIEALGVKCRYRLRRRVGNDPKIGLRGSESLQHVHPTGQAGALGEQRQRLRRGPAVPVDRRVDQMRVHCHLPCPVRRQLIASPSPFQPSTHRHAGVVTHASTVLPLRRRASRGRGAPRPGWHPREPALHRRAIPPPPHACNSD